MAPKKTKTIRNDSAVSLVNDGKNWSKRDEAYLWAQRSPAKGPPCPYARLVPVLGRSELSMRLKMNKLREVARERARKKAAALDAEMATEEAKKGLLASEALPAGSQGDAARLEAAHTLVALKQGAVDFSSPLAGAVAGTRLDPPGALLTAVAPEAEMEDAEETEAEEGISGIPEGTGGIGGGAMGGVVSGRHAGAGKRHVSNIHSLLN